jgi:hypothetical protein
MGRHESLEPPTVQPGQGLQDLAAPGSIGMKCDASARLDPGVAPPGPASLPAISTLAFWLPKAGNASDEYEDAFFVGPGDRPLIRAAVGDGASEASFSGAWAWQLTRAYCAARSNRDLLRCLPAMRRAWRAEVDRKPLPWYAEEKARKGAFSSLVGLTIRPDRWDAMAVGDSCLFQVRGESLVAAFPLERSDEFDNSPFLISSSPASDGSLETALRFRSGRWLPGDVFYLLTDALACWFLRRHEEDGSAGLCLSDIRSQAIFNAFITEARAEQSADQRLRNDDVTLLRVDLGPSDV